MEIKNWSELPVGKLEEIRAADKGIVDEDTKILTIAGILADKTYSQMLDLPLNETQRLISNTSFLYTEPKRKKLSSVYRLNGTNYRILKNMNEMTTAQYIDYQAIARDSFERVSEFLSIFFIPEGYKYNDGNYDREKVVADISNYLSAEEALGISAFFTKRCVRLIRRMLVLLEAKAMLMRMGRRETRELAKKTQEMIQDLRRTYGFL